MDHQCRSCGDRRLEQCLDLGIQPVAHRLLASAQETDKITHPLVLHVCRNCGLIQILDPIAPELLYLDYNYCFSSWKPQPHLTAELQLLKEHAHGGPVLEIGSNDGLFLQAMMDIGFQNVMGIEPNREAGRVAADRGIRTYQGLIEESLCRKLVDEHGRFHLVLARQVVEHIGDLKGFFKCIDTLLADDGFLFLDFPDLDTALAMGDCSAVWEEHINYFTEPVMVNLMHSFGFTPRMIERYDFSGGALAILARRSNQPHRQLDVTANINQALLYSDKVQAYGDKLKNNLAGLRDNGREIVLYGVGCRACTTVNGLGLGPYIDYAVDDQLEKQNMYLPGSRLPIRPLDYTRTNNRRKVFLLAVNNENESKVTANIRRLHGEDADAVSLFSPKDIWEQASLLTPGYIAAGQAGV